MNESLGSDKQLIIPIFSQEYAARIALACIIDINFMNNSTELTKEFENSITNPALRDKYKNYLYIEGMQEDSKNVAFYERHGFHVMEGGTPIQICNFSDKR